MNALNKKHRPLSKIKAEATNLWTKPDCPDFVRNRERLNKEFLEAQAAGAPWESESESVYKNVGIKWN